MDERRVLFLDLVGGASGDMLLAALVDVGASLERVRRALEIVGLDSVELRTSEAHPAGLRARRIDVFVRGALADREHAEHSHGGHSHSHGTHVHRRWAEIRERLEHSSLSQRVREISLDAFERLAHAEARAHGVPIDDVEFHEVGSDDAIADIVGTATAFVELSPSETVVSPPPMGRGLAQGAHGPIPIPGPATLALLSGVPIESTSLVGETVTPTGAALIRAIAARFGSIPSMTVERIGVGAGHREWHDRPNIVRAILGRARLDAPAESHEDCIVEANLDDMNPEHVGALERALFSAGAIDVWSTPIHAKKGRAALVVSALARTHVKDAIRRAFFIHSTTLGVRSWDVARTRAERRVVEVDTPYGKVRVKVSDRTEGPPLVAPENDDCERIASERGVSLRAVYEAALAAAWARA